MSLFEILFLLFHGLIFFKSLLTLWSFLHVNYPYLFFAHLSIEASGFFSLLFCQSSLYVKNNIPLLAILHMFPPFVSCFSVAVSGA